MNSRLPLRSWIEIDFQRLESNVRSIKSTLPAGVKYVCVVKADAYGHCMPHALVRFARGGADIFAVANLYEASRVREIIPDKPVLVLSPVLAQERPLVFDYGATPAVSSYSEASAFADLARSRGKTLGVHIKLDTGMGRAGIWHERAVGEIKKILGLKGIKVTGIFSHLSSADDDAEYTKRQFGIFREVVSHFDLSGMLVHLHNYGINPFAEGEYEGVQLQSVLSFRSRILAVSSRAGKRIATVAAGYADGVPSGFTDKARVIAGGAKCPILGNVGLDETVICVDSAKDVKVGDTVTFIGEQDGLEISLVDYSRWTRRIPWETMVAIPRRVGRVFK